MKKILFFLTLFLLSAGMSWAQNTIYVLPTISPDGTVIKVNGVSGAAYSTLPAAVSHATAGDIVKLLDDVTVAATTGGYNKAGIIHNGYTLDGNGHILTVTGAATTWDCAIYTHGGTIKNLTVKGAPSYVMRGLFTAGCNQDIIVDNVTFEKVLYTFSADGASNYDVIFNKCNMNGWTSYTNGFKSVTFTDCTFAEGMGYAYFRPYEGTVVQGCTFSTDMEVDPSINTIFFNDCNIDGTDLTSDNLNDLLEIPQEDPNSKAVVVDGDFSTNSDGEITGGVYGGNLEVLNDKCADGYAGFPIPNTDPQTYLVTPIWYIHFDPVDGNGTMADQYIARDTINFKVPACTFTHNYSFAGWYTQPYGGGSAVAVGSTMQLTSDTTLYAYWAYDYVAKIGTTTYISLQAAVNDAYANMTGDVTIELVKDVTAWTLVKQKAGLNLTIDGQDHNIYGQILIDGTGRHTGTESLTIQNINFEYDEAGFNSAVPKAFIYFPKNETGLIYSSGHNHAHNVTVKYCTFDGDNKTVTYGIFAPTGTDGVYHITFDHLTMTSVFMPTMMNATTDLTVINVKATDVEEGINIANGNGDFIITNDTISSSTYALRVRGSGTKTANLADNYFVGTNSILFGNDGTATINIASGRYDGLIAYHTGYSESNDHTTFSITGGTYNEDVTPKCATHYAAYYDQGSSNPQTWTVKKEYEVAFDANGGTGTMNNVWVGAPTSTYTYSVPGCDFTNPDGVSFLAWNTKADGSGTTLNVDDEMTISSDTTLYAQWGYIALNVTRNVGYTTLKAAVENAQDGEEIKLLKNTDENVIQIYNSLTIDGCGYTVNGMGTYNSARVFRISNSNTDITIKNLKMVGKNPTYDNSGEGNDSRGVSFDSDLNNITLLIDNCNISATSYALNVVVGCSNLNITVSNSYLKGRAAFNSYSSDSYVTFIKDTLHGVNIQNGCEEPYILEAFSTINLDGYKLNGNYPGGAKNTFVSLENCMVYAEMQGTCDQNWIGMRYGVSSCNVIADSQTKFINIGQLAGYPDVHIDGREYYNEGYGNTITLFLGEGQESQRDILKNWHYNVTNNTDGSNTISYTLYYETGNPSTSRDFYDFYTPFTTVDDGHVLTMIGDVTLTQDINLGIDGDLKLNFDGHDIKVNGHKIILTTDNTTVTTDMRCDSLFDSSVDGKGVKVTDNGNYTFTYSTEPYKCLNVDKNAGYVYIEDAIDNADKGDTIRLLVDKFELTNSLVISQGITLDLNSDTITNTAQYAIKITNGEVTIKNGSIISTNSHALYCEGAAKLNVIDCDVTATTNTIVNASTDSVKITRGKISRTNTNNYSLNNTSKGVINVNGTTFPGNNHDYKVYNQSTGTINLDGCTIPGRNHVVQNHSKGTVRVNNCVIDGSDYVVQNENSVNGGEIYIDGSTLTGTASASYVAYNYKGGKMYVSNSEINAPNGYGVQIGGGTSYNPLIDINNCAINAKSYGINNSTSGLINVYGNTTINAEKYGIANAYNGVVNIYGNTTIAVTSSNVNQMLAVYHSGSGITNIGGYMDENDDLVANGNVTITINPNSSSSVNSGAYCSNGLINILGNAIINAQGEYATAGVICLDNGKVNISGGTINAENAVVVANSTTKTTISGGTFNLSGDNANAINISGQDTVIVTGGTFTATGANDTIFKGAGNGAVFTITDATLNAAAMFNLGNGDSCSVNGGKFTATDNMFTNAGKLALNGGVFTQSSDNAITNTGTFTVNDGWYSESLTRLTRGTPRWLNGDDISYYGTPELHLIKVPADSVAAAGLTGDYWQLGNTITYDANGGTGSESQDKAKDETVQLSDGTGFSYEGNTLYGWNTQDDGNGTPYEFGADYSDNADLTLYAVWNATLKITSLDTIDVTCYHQNNGKVEVNIAGGVSPFQYVLLGGSLTKNDTVDIAARTYTFENLKPGVDYYVIVNDGSFSDTSIKFTISEPDTLEITSLTVPEKPCPLMGTGAYNVSVAAQGGNTGNYTYTWGEAAVNIDADATTVIPGADDRDSTYTVSVTVIDSKGCTATATTTFSVSPVIADDGTVHSNTKLEVTPDTIKFGIYQGCDTVIKDYGTPTFTFTNPAITEDILDTIYNDVATNFPDSIFPVGTSIITWTALDTCGHSVTCEQAVIIYQQPCPNAVDKENNSYPAVRIGCTCWMAENLKSTKYSDGRDIENVMTYVNSDYPNEVENASIYGHLYDWYAAVDTAINSIASVAHKDSLGKRVQGVCPAGWYLPNEKDLADLYSYDTKDLRSTDLWIEGGGTNATGFHAVPSGFFNCSTGRYEELKGECIYWSCHPVYDKVTGAIISYVCDKLMNNTMDMCNGLSVRCLLITEPQD